MSISTSVLNSIEYSPFCGGGRCALTHGEDMHGKGGIYSS
jgi:hypothetical protein